jgi:hypothetical protein
MEILLDEKMRKKIVRRILQQRCIREAVRKPVDI